jgi:hypothetical protein
MDVYACDPVMPVLPVVAMRGFITQPSPLTFAEPVRGPREPARGAQEHVPLQAARSRASKKPTTPCEKDLKDGR